MDLVIGHGEILRGAFSKYFGSNCILTPTENLDDRSTVYHLLESNRPKRVFFTGGYWYGLLENRRRPADLGYFNTQIILNVIYSSFLLKVEKLLFVSSSCMYPPDATPPIREDSLMSGPLEPISEPSALSRLLGHKLLTYYNRQHGMKFVTVVPTGMYGPHDDFCPETGHVLPALIERFHRAKLENKHSEVLWGTGRPLREWVYVDDIVEACIFAMEHCDNDLVNIAPADTSGELTIESLAQLVANVVGYKGGIDWDMSSPDGAYRKKLDGSKLGVLGWKPKVSLDEGIRKTYEWYKSLQ